MPWKWFLHHWPFVRGIHQLLVDSPHKGPVIQSIDVFFVVNPTCCWTNSEVAGDLWCHAHPVPLLYYTIGYHTGAGMAIFPLLNEASFTTSRQNHDYHLTHISGSHTKDNCSLSYHKKLETKWFIKSLRMQSCNFSINHGSDSNITVVQLLLEY